MAQISTVGTGLVWPAGGALQPLTDCSGGAGCGGLVFESSPWVFAVLTVVIGGGCAFISGRSVAQGWKPMGLAVVYALLLACAVRFLHFGLLRGTLLSPYYLVVDAAVLVLLALAGYGTTRAGQMATQYPWKYRRRGLFGWSAIENGAEAPATIAGSQRTG